MFFKEASVQGGKRAKSRRKKVGKTLRVARAFRLSQLFIRNIASCSCREVAKSPSAPRCVGLTGTLTRHNTRKMIYFKMEHIAVASLLLKRLATAAILALEKRITFFKF